MPNRALFLDRDGTIIEERGYIGTVEQIVVIDGAVEAVRRANKLGLKVIVVSNQSGVARGYFTEGAVKAVNDCVRSLFASAEAVIDAFYYCPHGPTGSVSAYVVECQCRKPKPGMFLTAAKEHDIDLRSSFVVGDSARDIEAGRSAGTEAIMVLTGFGREERRKIDEKVVHIVADIAHAVSWIEERARNC